LVIDSQSVKTIQFIDEASYGWQVKIAQKSESAHGFVPEKNGTGRPALGRSTQLRLRFSTGTKF
jgi:hypothetical protein